MVMATVFQNINNLSENLLIGLLTVVSNSNLNIWLKATFSQCREDQSTDTNSQNILLKCHLWLGTARSCSHVLDWAQHPALCIWWSIYTCPLDNIHRIVAHFYLMFNSFFIWRKEAPFLFKVKNSRTDFLSCTAFRNWQKHYSSPDTLHSH